MKTTISQSNSQNLKARAKRLESWRIWVKIGLFWFSFVQLGLRFDLQKLDFPVKDNFLYSVLHQTSFIIYVREIESELHICILFAHFVYFTYNLLQIQVSYVFGKYSRLCIKNSLIRNTICFCRLNWMYHNFSNLSQIMLIYWYLIMRVYYTTDVSLNHLA